MPTMRIEGPAKAFAERPAADGIDLGVGPGDLGVSHDDAARATSSGRKKPLRAPKDTRAEAETVVVLPVAATATTPPT